MSERPSLDELRRELVNARADVASLYGRLSAAVIAAEAAIVERESLVVDLADASVVAEAAIVKSESLVVDLADATVVSEAVAHERDSALEELRLARGSGEGAEDL